MKGTLLLLPKCDTKISYPSLTINVKQISLANGLYLCLNWKKRCDNFVIKVRILHKLGNMDW